MRPRFLAGALVCVTVEACASESAEPEGGGGTKNLGGSSSAAGTGDFGSAEPGSTTPGAGEGGHSDTDLSPGGTSSGEDGGAAESSAGENTGGTRASSSGAPGTGGAEEDAGGAGSGGEGALPSCVDPLNLPLIREAPKTLAETGLYASGSAAPNEVAPYVRPFQPHYELWSDGAEKHRFVYLPACTQIDTTNMDYWKFPVGVRFWKEFRRDGTLVETRFIHRYGPGEKDWLFVPYQWDPSELTPDQARRVDDGVTNANGTEHDIPSRKDCLTCHVNLPEPPLAFSAIQLSHSLSGVTLRTLSDEGWLSQAAPRDYLPPGDARAQAALGYLHANCGHCHNSHIRTAGNSLPGDPAPRFRLSVSDTTVESTTTYTTLVSVGTFNPAYRDYNRIEPCNPGLSSVLLRMITRTGNQMPPLATERVDEAGVETVRAFLRHLHAPGVPACPE